jgi:predicted acylesterase/phospholipase RssA
MRGLALSGGAAFGAYQVGVWRALSERGWRPDVTTGISIGAVNAWLMARDIPYDELQAIWLEWPAELLPGRERRFDLPWRVHLPMFRAWIERIAAEYGPRRLVREGRMTMLEAGTGQMRTMSVADAGASDLLAACALPGVMAPVRTRGSLYLDCGILRYIPMRETVEAGADDIVLVDLLAAHPFPAARRVRRAILNLRNRFAAKAYEPYATESEGVHVTLVAHRSPLGGVLESFRWTRAFVERLVDDGYRDGCSAFDQRRHETMPAPAHSMRPSAVSAPPQ